MKTTNRIMKVMKKEVNRKFKMLVRKRTMITNSKIINNNENKSKVLFIHLKNSNNNLYLNF